MTVDLTTVVIGGGVAKAGPVLFDPVQRWVKRLAQLPFVADLTVEPAQLDNAGLIGAARLGWDALRAGTAFTPAGARPAVRDSGLEPDLDSGLASADAAGAGQG